MKATEAKIQTKRIICVKIPYIDEFELLTDISKFDKFEHDLKEAHFELLFPKLIYNSLTRLWIINFTDKVFLRSEGNKNFHYRTMSYEDFMKKNIATFVNHKFGL